MVGFDFGRNDTIITVTWIFYFSSSKVEHVGLVMIYWLMSSCHNKDILNDVNFALKV